MPKKYDYEKLKEEALKLRAEGLSYREIAKRLGCSTYVVSQVLKEYEKERQKKIGEMTAELAELEETVQEFTDDIASIESRLSNIKGRISKIERMESVENVVSLSSRVDKLEINMEIVKDYINILDMAGKEKLKRCVYYDERNGFCMERRWDIAPRNRHIYDATKDMVSHFTFMPQKFPALCAVCPFYQPKRKI